MDSRFILASTLTSRHGVYHRLCSPDYESGALARLGYPAHALLVNQGNREAVKISKFSIHAREKMHSRNVKVSDVHATLTFPDALYEDVEHGTHIAIKKVNGNSIILAYKMENDGAKVITLFYTTKLDKLLKTKTARGAWIKQK